MDAIEGWPIATMLVMGNIINVMLMKPDWLNKRGKPIISLLSTSIMAFSILYLYSHYTFEPLHIMNHTLFKTAYILTMLIMVQENIQVLLGVTKRLYNAIELNLFDKLNYSISRIVLKGVAQRLYNAIELNLFDKLNYSISRIALKTAKLVQRIQTGDLNINMLIVLGFFLLFITILILGNFM